MFIFTILYGVSKGFKKAFKAFIKSFEAPQSAKIKISVKFYFNTTFWMIPTADLMHIVWWDQNLRSWLEDELSRRNFSHTVQKVVLK